MYILEVIYSRFLQNSYTATAYFPFPNDYDTRQPNK
jgi:hypothetical protein